MYVCNFCSLLNIDVTQSVEALPGKDQYIIYIQYHNCWWPGETRSQGISTYVIDPAYPSLFQFQWKKD